MRRSASAGEDELHVALCEELEHDENTDWLRLAALVQTEAGAYHRCRGLRIRIGMPARLLPREMERGRLRQPGGLSKGALGVASSV